MAWGCIEAHPGKDPREAHCISQVDGQHGCLSLTCSLVHALIQRVEAEILERGLFVPNSRLLVAVSGGIDSMVLLALLRELAPRHGWELAVAHFNHRLRGRASQADERLVERVCREGSIPFFRGETNVRGEARDAGVSVEMAARALRHDFLARTARRHRIGTIVLAQHADDQVELFFLRLLRGSSSVGLGGMKWSSPSPADPRVTLVRPLLNCSRAEVLEFASQRPVRFREDATNVSLDIPRNRVRHGLIPLLRSFQPALQRVILRQGEVLGAEADLLSELASAWRAHPDKPFARLPVALQRAVLRAGLTDLGFDPEFELLEALRTCPERVVTFPGGAALMHDGEGRLTKAASRQTFNAESLPVQFHGRAGQGIFGGLCWRWRVTPVGKVQPTFGPGQEWFDAEKVGSEVLLRHWTPGDRFQPCGAGFTAKLQDLFTNQKVPGPARKGLVVAATKNGQLWWVEGLRIADAFKLSPGTRAVLHWSWERRMSPESG